MGLDLLLSNTISKWQASCMLQQRDLGMGLEADCWRRLGASCQGDVFSHWT